MCKHGVPCPVLAGKGNKNPAKPHKMGLGSHVNKYSETAALPLLNKHVKVGTGGKIVPLAILCGT